VRRDCKCHCLERVERLIDEKEWRASICLVERVQIILSLFRDVFITRL
jgi:hypothetical protein